MPGPLQKLLLVDTCRPGFPAINQAQVSLETAKTHLPPQLQGCDEELGLGLAGRRSGQQNSYASLLQTS